MALFYIKDSDRPAYVVAMDWQEAVNKWKRAVANENDEPNIDNIDEPLGIEHLCADNELIIYTDFFR